MQSSQLKFITDAWSQIIECRRILSWTYTYGAGGPFHMPACQSFHNALRTSWFGLRFLLVHEVWPPRLCAPDLGASVHAGYYTYDPNNANAKQEENNKVG